MKPAVFFDRDGVLNQAIISNNKPYPPKNINELVIVEEANNALARLKNAGFMLFIVTNQPDVARGSTTQASVEAINDEIMQVLPIDAAYVCYHDDKDQCLCRKPLPGLLMSAAKDYQIDLKNSYMIGDRYKDIAAGNAAHCKTIWLRTNYDEPKPLLPHFTSDTLRLAVAWILKQD